MRARAVPDRGDDGTVVKADRHDDGRHRAGRGRPGAPAPAETRFEIGFEQAAIGAVIADLDGIPIRVNPAVCAFLGRPPRTARRADGGPSSPTRTSCRSGTARLARLAAGHDTYEDERRYLRPDGSHRVGAVARHPGARRERVNPSTSSCSCRTSPGARRWRRTWPTRRSTTRSPASRTGPCSTDRLVHGLAGSRRRGSQLGVIFLDVDHFKVVNDSLGPHLR